MSGNHIYYKKNYLSTWRGTISFLVRLLDFIWRNFSNIISARGNFCTSWRKEEVIEVVLVTEWSKWFYSVTKHVLSISLSNLIMEKRNIRYRKKLTSWNPKIYIVYIRLYIFNMCVIAWMEFIQWVSPYRVFYYLVHKIEHEYFRSWKIPNQTVRGNEL